MFVRILTFDLNLTSVIKFRFPIISFILKFSKLLKFYMSLEK